MKHMIENHTLGKVKLRQVHRFASLAMVLSQGDENWKVSEETYLSLEGEGEPFGGTHL